MPHAKIDASRLEVYPLSQRENKIPLRQSASDWPLLSTEARKQVAGLAARIVAARASQASVMLTYGAHLVKNLAGPKLNELVAAGHITHLATQGAGVIHDWELAFQGATGESVEEGAQSGRFGSWDETGRWLNLAVLLGATEGLGFGEAVGKLIVEDGLTLPDPDALRTEITAEPLDEFTAARCDLLHTMVHHDLPAGRVVVEHPHKDHSILACAYEHGVPLTVHPGIGYDIIVNHPLYHGAAIGRAATTDARIFAQSVLNLSGGVHISVGSAIMSPQVFEKAFSAANNLLRQEDKPLLRDHCLAIVDLQDGGGWDWNDGEPPEDNPAYYLRYCKSFSRMGGTLTYVQCDNRALLAGLAERLA